MQGSTILSGWAGLPQVVRLSTVKLEIQEDWFRNQCHVLVYLQNPISLYLYIWISPQSCEIVWLKLFQFFQFYGVLIYGIIDFVMYTTFPIFFILFYRIVNYVMYTNVLLKCIALSHSGRATHICVGKLTTIG